MQEGFRLKSGGQLPLIGIGTDGFTDLNQAERMISEALNKHKGGLIDTATGYGTHPIVAKVLKNQNRDKVFICTKFHNGNLAELGSVQAIVANILKELETAHIDLLLLHNPAIENFPAVFKDMIALKKSGLIKSIGVSNFTRHHLGLLKEDIEHVDVNQVEIHPYLIQADLRKFCQEHQIVIMAYRPFCEGRVLQDPVLQALAHTHEKTVAQIVLNWHVQLGMMPIVKTSKSEHLEELSAIGHFQLSAEELHQISGLNKPLRSCTGPWARFEEKGESDMIDGPDL